MCVAITLEAGTLLSVDEIAKMQRANADGVGVCWTERGVVHWSKAMNPTPEKIYEIIRDNIDFPRLAHFRLATAGGAHVALCHPFDISPLALCTQYGKSKKMMIHNGHWSRWHEVLKLLEGEELLPDKGPWSDSRLGAFLASEDPEWLEGLGGRVATLDEEGVITRIGDWTELREGVWVSNKIWDFTNVKRGGYSGFRQWKGWDWDESDWAELDKELKEQEERDKAAFEAEMAKDECSLEKRRQEKTSGKETKDKAKRDRKWQELESRHSSVGQGSVAYSKSVNPDEKNARYVKNKRGEWIRIHWDRDKWYDKEADTWFRWDSKSQEVVETTAPNHSGEERETGSGGEGVGGEVVSGDERNSPTEKGLTLEGSARLTHWSEYDVGGEG